MQIFDARGEFVTYSRICKWYITLKSVESLRMGHFYCELHTRTCKAWHMVLYIVVQTGWVLILSGDIYCSVQPLPAVQFLPGHSPQGWDPLVKFLTRFQSFSLQRGGGVHKFTDLLKLFPPTSPHSLIFVLPCVQVVLNHHFYFRCTYIVHSL